MLPLADRTRHALERIAADGHDDSWAEQIDIALRVLRVVVPDLELADAGDGRAVARFTFGGAVRELRGEWQGAALEQVARVVLGRTAPPPSTVE